jgi:hypothetical protein
MCGVLKKCAGLFPISMILKKRFQKRVDVVFERFHRNVFYTEVFNFWNLVNDII